MAEKDCGEIGLAEKSKPTVGEKIRKHQIEVEVKIKWLNCMEKHRIRPF